MLRPAVKRSPYWLLSRFARGGKLARPAGATRWADRQCSRLLLPAPPEPSDKLGPEWQRELAGAESRSCVKPPDGPTAIARAAALAEVQLLATAKAQLATSD